MLFPLISALLLPIMSSNNNLSYSTSFEVVNHELVEINDKNASEIRIYKEREVTRIAFDAFIDCKFSSIMISNTVEEIDSIFPSTLTTINYTSSREDFKFDIPENVTFFEYGCDEGFLNYWSNYIRPNIDGNICNVNKDHYLKMKYLYINLSGEDKAVVDNKEDGTGTIKDSVNFLDSYFSSSSSRAIEKEISQSTMITFVLVVASFGMTSIGVFYILKDRKIIE